MGLSLSIRICKGIRMALAVGLWAAAAILYGQDYKPRFVCPINTSHSHPTNGYHDGQLRPAIDEFTPQVGI